MLHAISTRESKEMWLTFLSPHNDKNQGGVIYSGESVICVDLCHLEWNGMRLGNSYNWKWWSPVFFSFSCKSRFYRDQGSIFWKKNQKSLVSSRLNAAIPRCRKKSELFQGAPKSSIESFPITFGHSNPLSPSLASKIMQTLDYFRNFRLRALGHAFRNRICAGL